MVVSFIDGENWNNLEKTTDLQQVTDKLYHIMLYQVNLDLTGFEHNICGDRH